MFPDLTDNRAEKGEAAFKIIFVTNRDLVPAGEDCAERLRKLASAKPDGIILREKRFGADEYRPFAEEAMRLCGRYGVPCILHGFPEVASELDSPFLHLPLEILCGLSADERKRFAVLGASCHSMEEAEEAERLGCSYITAGHIYATDCKKGLPGRGIGFLRSICAVSRIPVYAIGGIRAENISEVAGSGAAGACVMSGAMQCADAHEYLRELRQSACDARREAEK